MSKREGPDQPATPASASENSAPDALTSGDIFGEILDEVGGQRLDPAEATRVPSGRGPIKVQVSEPDPATRLARAAAPPGRPGVKELRPEDVATLLDVFTEPTDAGLTSEAPTAPLAQEPLAEEPFAEQPLAEESLADELAMEPDWGPPDAVDPEPLELGGDEPQPIDDPLEELGRDEPEPMEATPFTPDALDVEPFLGDGLDPEPDFDPELLEEPDVPALVFEEDERARLVLEQEQGADDDGPLEPMPPPPPAMRDPSDRGTDEGLRDLMNLMRVTKSRAHLMEAGPNKFTAAEPVASSTLPAVDLASLAAEALDDSVPAALAHRPSRALPKMTGEIHYGPYRLLQRIAVGGMAEVFRGKRAGVEGFEKVVAVKRILPHLSDNKEFVDMFIDEAKMVGGLTHPNIVQIFDLGKIEKTYFIAMEYVHGRDLRTILRRTREKGLRVPLDLAVLIVSRVCSALEFAHRKKDERGQPMLIVHRDVSPQNILISFEGEVKLTDFGIAKAASKATVTDAGALRGKLLYMSPEQAWGKAMDRRSDLFSLGIVLYEMATDQKPFLGNSEMSILEMVRECSVVPPAQADPRVPERLEQVLLKALDRDVEARYQDAAEMFHDLERALPERPAAGVDLARFLEVLFDEGERSETTAGAAAAVHHPGAPAEVHVEFDSAQPAAAAEPSPPEEEIDQEAVPVAPKVLARDPMSIQKLLKRFGIK